MDAPGDGTVEIDGERFGIRTGALDHDRAAVHYSWLSGPDPGYGFSTGGPIVDEAEHVRRIREFLAEIDPDTGHLRE